jgi:hypothetical protein
MKLEIRWADKALARFGSDVDRLNREFPKVLPRIVNQVGDRAKTQVIRNLTKQTGLPRKTIVKAIGDPSRASAGTGKLSYQMTTRGGNIRLKYFAPKETRPGVVAKPFGQRTLFAQTFMFGGRFPNRHGGNFDGNVMKRIGYGDRADGSRGEKLTQVRSGVFIPEEMTKGATAAAFERTAALLLEERVNAAIKKLLP